MSFKDYQSWAEERKKRPGNDKYTQWVFRTHGKELLDAFTKRANDWINKSNSFLSDNYNRYSGRKGNYEDSYVSDSADWLASTTERRSELDREKSELQRYLNYYSPYLDSGYSSELNKVFRNASTQYDNVVKTAQSDVDYWGRWENEDAYNQAKEQQKVYNDNLNYDLVGAQKEIDKYSYLDDAKDTIGKLNMENTMLWFSANILGNQNDAARLEINNRKIEKLKADYEEYYPYLSELRQKYAVAERVQNAAALSSVGDPDSENYDPEFDKYSEYVSTNPGVNMDIGYEYINGDESTRRKLESRYQQYLLENYIDKGYGQLKEKEKKIYNYYYSKHGKEAADEYLFSIQDTLNARQAGVIFENVNDSALSEVFFGAYAGFEQFDTGIKNLMNTTDSYIAPTPTQIASGWAREDLADNGLPLWYNFKEKKWEDKILGSSGAQIAYDALNTSANMLPSTMMATFANLWVPGSGSYVGSALLGASAAGNAKAEMLQMGYSKEQANKYGLMVGASEAIMERVLGGIPGLKGGDGIFSSLGQKIIGKFDNAFARVAITIGGNMLDEALEEGLQTVLEPWMKEAATNVDWESASVDEVLYSSLLGALSSIGFSAGGIVSSNVQSNSVAKDKYGAQPQGLVTEALELDPNSKVALRAQERINAGKNVSGRDILSMVENNDRIVTEQDTAKIKTAVEARLSELGERGDVSAIANALTKQAKGEELTRSERSLIESSDFGQRVANELNRDNIKSGQYSSAWAESIGTRRVGADIYNKSSPDAAGAQNVKAESTPAMKENPVVVVAKDSKGNTVKGEIRGIQVNGDKVSYNLSDGSTVRADKVSFATENEALVAKIAAERVGRVEGFTTEAALAMIKGYDGSVSVSEYASTFNEAFSLGAQGADISGAVSLGKSKGIDSGTVYAAYVLGQKVSAESDKAEVQRLSAQDTENGEVQLTVSGRNTERDVSGGTELQGVQAEINEKTSPEGKVVYSSNKAKAVDAVPIERYDDGQKRIAIVAHQIGRKVVFAKTFNEKGAEVDGFLGTDGVVYINPNNPNPMAFVFKHELAHFCERAGQKYRDFVNTVRFSQTFKGWLRDKGFNSELEYNSQIRSERSEIGQDLDEPGATREIMANFVGEMMFGDNTELAERIISELAPEPRKTFVDYIRSFFSWIKKKLYGDSSRAKSEIEKLESKFAAAYREAVKSPQNIRSETKYSFQGYAEDGKGKYKSNFPKGTPKSAKAKVILDYIQNVWSKKPIDLNITENGETRTIKAQFDPTYTEDRNNPTDASKLMGGNRHGTSSDQRVTLDLADDYYQIASESTYNYSKDETGKDHLAHKDVKRWHYFINDIYFAEYDSDKYTPYRVTINIKEKADGTFVYSFSAENQERLNTPRTLHAVVNSGEATANVQPSDNSIFENEQNSNSQNAQNSSGENEQFSYTPVDPAELLERYEKGEISREEFLERMRKKPEKENPATIASLAPEDMKTTPNLAKKTGEAQGKAESRFHGSLQRSSIFDEKFKEEAKKDNFIEHYSAITNEDTLKEAARLLDEGGEAYVESWKNKRTVEMSTVDTVVGFILLKRYQDVGNYEGAIAVAQKIREVGTISGQRVQAFSIIGRYDADMMQAYAQKELAEAWEKAVIGRSEKWAAAHKAQFELTAEEIAFIRDNILYAATLPEGSREKAIALAHITTLLQNKIPPVKGQSYKAWQRVSMLLNPKTQIRNILGNAVMVPVFVASDWFSAPLDMALSRITGVRTTGFTGTRGNRENLEAMRRGAFESYDDWKRHINTRQHDLNRFEIGQGKSFDETKWGRIAKIMNETDRFTSFLLDAGDRTFYEMWFTNSLNEQMRLNKVSEPTEAMVQAAVDEALERTWQDDNFMTKMVGNIKAGANKISIGGYGLGDVLVKFTKTPANLTKAIYEFSPAAVATLAPQAVTLTRSIKNGTVTPAMQKRFVSSFGKMAAGTMLYVIFGALYNAGRISGASDEDDDVAAFEKYIQGIPEYSVKIGNKWFSYDWAQPVGAVPAVIADFMESKKEGDSAIDSIIGAFKVGGEVLFNQSFMTSLRTLCAADSFMKGLVDAIYSDITVPIPTLFSQVANIFDDKRRVTYDSTSEWQSAINRAISKFPGLRNLLTPDVDIFGREVANSQQDWFNAFFNPANVYTDTSSEVSDHVYEIYKSTGDAGAIPAKAPYDVDLQGVKKKLNDVERAEYQKTMGATANEMIEALLQNDVYLAMNDEYKLAVLRSVYSYAAAVAKSELDWYDSYEVIHGISEHITRSDFDSMSEEERIRIVDEYLLSDYNGMYNIESDEGKANYFVNQKIPGAVLSATMNNDIEAAKALIDGIDERVNSYGWDKVDTEAEIKDRRSAVRRTLTIYWKAAYLAAYRKTDDSEMERIRKILVETGAYGRSSEVNKTLREWVKAYDEEN